MAVPKSFYMDIKKINIAHEYVIDKNNRCEYPNSRKYYGVIYCIEGEAKYIFSNKKTCVVKKGEVLFICPEAAYTIATDNQFRHYTVNFELHSGFSEIDFLDDVYFVLHTENSLWYAHTMKKLVNLWYGRQLGFEMQSVACLYEILAFLCREIFEEKYNSKSHMMLREAKEYIDRNFNKEICLDMLANLSNMSVANFTREWKKLYSGSPIGYRDNVRLCYAKEYLLCGYYTVSEVAEKCGFNDTNYFVRFFKKHTAITPGMFKKSYE